MGFKSIDRILNDLHHKDLMMEGIDRILNDLHHKDLMMEMVLDKFVRVAMS